MHLVVINPASFHRQEEMGDFVSGAADCFSELGAKNCHIHISRFQRDSIGAIREYAEKAGPGAPVRVYAVGGGGIAFDCLNGIVGLPGAELAAVTFRRGDEFKRARGELARALIREVASRSMYPAAPMDIIRCNGTYGINKCTVGLESRVGVTADELLDKLTWWPAFIGKSRRVSSFVYYFAAMASMASRKTRSQEYEIRFDGETLAGKYTSINIVNSPYSGGLSPAISAVPDDGAADVIFYKDKCAVDALTRMFQNRRGQRVGHFPSEFAIRHGTEVSVSSSEPFFVNIDGEAFSEMSVKVSLIKSAVMVVKGGGAEYEGRK
jgi:diacylglycerol kinase family enzyme